MTYVPVRTAETQLRFIVLYALEKTGPCTCTQLERVLCAGELMNYFDMMFALTDLCREGQAVRENTPAQELYRLTPAGRETLRLFPQSVPESARETVDAAAGEWRERFNRERECASAIRRNGSGWEAELMLTDQTEVLMKLTLPMPDENAARDTAERWTETGGEIYAAVIALLAGEKHERMGCYPLRRTGQPHGRRDEQDPAFCGRRSRLR